MRVRSGLPWFGLWCSGCLMPSSFVDFDGRTGALEPYGEIDGEVVGEAGGYPSRRGPVGAAWADAESRALPHLPMDLGQAGSLPGGLPLVVDGVAISGGATVTVTDLESGEVRFTFPSTAGALWFTDGTRACAGFGPTLTCYELATGAQAWTLTLDRYVGGPVLPEPAVVVVGEVAYLPARGTDFTAATEDAVIAVDLAAGQVLWTFPVGVSGPRPLAVVRGWLLVVGDTCAADGGPCVAAVNPADGVDALSFDLPPLLSNGVSSPSPGGAVFLREGGAAWVAYPVGAEAGVVTHGAVRLDGDGFTEDPDVAALADAVTDDFDLPYALVDTLDGEAFVGLPSAGACRIDVEAGAVSWCVGRTGPTIARVYADAVAVGFPFGDPVLADRVTGAPIDAPVRWVFEDWAFEGQSNPQWWVVR